MKKATLTLPKRTLNLLLKRRPRWTGWEAVASAGLWLLPGRAYATDSHRLLGLPVDYEGPSMFIEWEAMLEAAKASEAGRLEVEGSTEDKRVPGLERFLARPEYVASFTVSRGDMLRAVKDIGKAWAVGIAVREGVATVYTYREGVLDARTIAVEQEGSPAVVCFQSRYLRDAAMLPGSSMRFDFEEQYDGGFGFRPVRVNVGAAVELIAPCEPRE